MGTDVSLTHAFAAGTLALWVPVSPPFAFALYPGFLSGEKLPSKATPLIIQSFGSDLIITGVFHDPGEVSFGPPRYLFEGVPLSEVSTSFLLNVFSTLFHLVEISSSRYEYIL